MKNILLIIKNNTKGNITMFICAIVVGVAMGLIFDLASSGNTFIGLDKVEVGVFDEDESLFTEDLCSYLEENLGMIVHKSSDNEELNDLLLNMDISAIIKVPNDTYDAVLNGEIKPLNIKTLDDYANSALIKAYTEAYMESVYVLSSAAEGDLEAFNKLLQENETITKMDASTEFSTTEEGQKSKSGYEFVLGFMLMSSAAIMFYVGHIILNDRKLGVYNRMRISSVEPVEYVVGNAIFGILAGSLMNVIFLMFPIIKGAEIGLPYALAFLLQELFVLCAVGVSIMLALLVKNQQQLVITLAIGFSALGGMIGGVFFPIDETLGFMSEFSKIFPQYWIMNAVRNLGDNPGYNYATDICALALFAVLFNLIAAVIFAKRKGQNTGNA